MAFTSGTAQLLTSLKIMEVMLESKAPLSELLKEITIFPQLMRNVKVRDKKAVKEDAAVMEITAEVEKELGSDGRILVRESGTEPVVRVMVEAASEEICCTQVERVVAVMKERGHIL